MQLQAAQELSELSAGTCDRSASNLSAAALASLDATLALALPLHFTRSSFITRRAIALGLTAASAIGATIGTHIVIIASRALAFEHEWLPFALVAAGILFSFAANMIRMAWGGTSLVTASRLAHRTTFGLHLDRTLLERTILMVSLAPICSSALTATLALSSAVLIPGRFDLAWMLVFPLLATICGGFSLARVARHQLLAKSLPRTSLRIAALLVPTLAVTAGSLLGIWVQHLSGGTSGGVPPNGALTAAFSLATLLAFARPLFAAFIRTQITRIPHPTTSFLPVALALFAAPNSSFERRSTIVSGLLLSAVFALAVFTSEPVLEILTRRFRPLLESSIEFMHLEFDPARILLLAIAASSLSLAPTLATMSGTLTALPQLRSPLGTTAPPRTLALILGAAFLSHTAPIASTAALTTQLLGGELVLSASAALLSTAVLSAGNLAQLLEARSETSSTATPPNVALLTLALTAPVLCLVLWLHDTSLLLGLVAALGLFLMGGAVWTSLRLRSSL
ncbi:hypothetical protein [Humidisolicoccus flavus]|uniref:hypothetical protein n=1 Tax=Humidisolicoccus flavus TaxID=3111414 RepID=UPI003252F762